MKLVKAFAYGICSFALASAAWAGGGLHDKSASSSPSMSSEPSSYSTSSESAARGDSSGAPWGAVESDSSATGATRDSSGQSTEPELLSSEQSTSEQYAAMEDAYWTSPGFSSSGDIPLGG